MRYLVLLTPPKGRRYVCELDINSKHQRSMHYALNNRFADFVNAIY